MIEWESQDMLKKVYFFLMNIKDLKRSLPHPAAETFVRLKRLLFNIFECFRKRDPADATHVKEDDHAV